MSESTQRIHPILLRSTISRRKYPIDSSSRGTPIKKDSSIDQFRSLDATAATASSSSLSKALNSSVSLEKADLTQLLLKYKTDSTQLTATATAKSTTDVSITESFTSGSQDDS